MDQICFKKDTFYTVIGIGALVIAYTLYRSYQAQNEQYLSQLNDFADNLKRQIDSQYTKAQRGGNNQDISDYIMATVIQRAHEHPTTRDLNRSLNPLVPPIRRNPYYEPPMHLGGPGGPGGMPINIPTRGEMGPFSQMGYMYLKGDSTVMMPLYGRRTYGNKHEYYTSHHHNPSVKIPVEVKGNEELSDGNCLRLPGYKGKFRVKLYPIDAPRYLH